MSIYKNSDTKIEKFEFSQFSTPEVELKDSIEAFEFEKLDLNKSPASKIDSETIRIERQFASKSDFQVDSRVKDYRGFSSQEEEDFQQKLDAAINAKYEEISKQAYEEGLKLGREDGRKEAFSEASNALEINLNKMMELLEDISVQKEEILNTSKKEVYSVVRNVAKWVALKEIKDDESSYLHSLLSKLITEINTKNNLSLKVSRNTYELMPNIINSIEKKLGTLENIKFEVSSEVENEGIILESNNGIVDASIESQFSMIDKIFNIGS